MKGNSEKNEQYGQTSKKLYQNKINKISNYNVKIDNISEMKNYCCGVFNKLDETEQRMSQPEDRSIEIIQTEL